MLFNKETLMNKQQYLAQPEVTNFIAWAASFFDNHQFYLNIASSRYVQGGISRVCGGIESVLEAYQWNASWRVPGELEDINSSDWPSTVDSLDTLSKMLREVVDAGDERRLYKLCREVLRWGGVRGALRFLSERAEGGELVSYLRDLTPLFSTQDNDDNELSALTAQAVRRFDAGITKIFALLDMTGSPIYDSRVGGSIAMLVATYCRSKAMEVPSSLRFPTGRARGDQVRNPGELGYDPAPNFYTRNVSPEFWAQSQVRLGWLLSQSSPSEISSPAKAT